MTRRSFEKRARNILTVLILERMRASPLRMGRPSFKLEDAKAEVDPGDDGVHRIIGSCYREALRRFLGLSETPGACMKRSWPTKAAAKRWARMNARRNREKPQRAYVCDRCGGAHLTSLNARRLKE